MGASTPGVVQVHSMELLVVFSSFRIIIWFLPDLGRLLFDMETEKLNGLVMMMFIVLCHIKYNQKVLDTNLSSSSSIVDALVVAVQVTVIKASLSSLPQDCQDDDNNNGQYTNTTSENIYNLV